jgi:hypothetical protein
MDIFLEDWRECGWVAVWRCSDDKCRPYHNFWRQAFIPGLRSPVFDRSVKKKQWSKEATAAQLAALGFLHYRTQRLSFRLQRLLRRFF